MPVKETRLSYNWTAVRLRRIFDSDKVIMIVCYT